MGSYKSCAALYDISNLLKSKILAIFACFNLGCFDLQFGLSIFVLDGFSLFGLVKFGS